MSPQVAAKVLDYLCGGVVLTGTFLINRYTQSFWISLGCLFALSVFWFCAIIAQRYRDHAEYGTQLQEMRGQVADIEERWQVARKEILEGREQIGRLQAELGYKSRHGQSGANTG